MSGDVTWFLKLNDWQSFSDFKEGALQPAKQCKHSSGLLQKSALHCRMTESEWVRYLEISIINFGHHDTHRNVLKVRNYDLRLEMLKCHSS